jgi:hypothetical protein
MENYYTIYIAKLDEMINEMIEKECRYGLHDETECQLHMLFENRKHAMEKLAGNMAPLKQIPYPPPA